MGLVFGMDIGGTSLKLGAWEGNDRLAWRESLAVPDSADERTVASAICDYFSDLAADTGPPARIGIGSCGIIRDGVILESPNTPWNRLELVKLVDQINGCRPMLVNDADAFLAGATTRLGIDVNNAIGITLGTGVGTAFRLDGRMISSGYGVSPEAGHITIDMHGEQATSGIRGTLEHYCGNAGLMRSFAGAGGRAGSPKEVAQRAGEGDKAALYAWVEYGRAAGVGLASLCNIFMPELVVIGGGLAGAHTYFDAALTEALDQQMLKSIPRPRLEYIDGQPDLVAFGAAVLAGEDL